MGLNYCSRPDYRIGKERLRWTQDLHDQFEKAVHQLGGPDRATPKSILKAMGIPGLTIYHIKSHLQKYRTSKFIPESTSRGKSEKRNILELLPNFSTTSGAQLNEALQLFIDMQTRLTDQVQHQRSLKRKIEAQRSFLEMITEEQKDRVTTTKQNNHFSPTSLPSLCDVSESSPKELDPNTTTIQSSKAEFQACRRLRTESNMFSHQYEFEAYDLDPSDQTKTFCPSLQDENSIPWYMFACSSHLVPGLP